MNFKLASVLAIFSTIVSFPVFAQTDVRFALFQNATRECEINEERSLIIKPYNSRTGLYVTVTITCANNKVLQTKFLHNQNSSELYNTAIELRNSYYGENITIESDEVTITLN